MNKIKGFINLKIEYSDGRNEVRSFKNENLKKSKYAIAKNFIYEEEKIYITHIIFGDGGTENNKKKEVNHNMDSLFGSIRLIKSVIPQIDPDSKNQIIIPVSIEKDEGNDYVLNEMAIKLSNGDLLCLATFKDIEKNKNMKLFWNWVIEF